MNYELSQKFYFEAAHTLKRDIEAEGSRRIHGHTYHAEVFVHGDVDPASGMLMDLAHLRAAIAEVRDTLDHHFLDEIADLRPATLENLCRYLFEQLSTRVPELSAVGIERTASGDKCVLRR